MYTSFMNMKRTQFNISEVTYRELIRISQVKGTSMAEVARGILEEGIDRVKDIDNTGVTAIENLLKIQATGGPKDLSTNLDHYLYGGPKKQI
jgi:hypothetical protein